MSTIIDLKDLSSKSAEIKPGNTVLLKDGTYSGLTIKISTSGTKDNRITIKPQNAGKVILTKSCNITINGSYITLANLVLKDGGSSKPAIYIIGNGNRITGCDVSYSASATEQMIRIQGKENRVDHNIFHDWNKSGVWVVVWRPNKTEDYALIDHNIFKNRISTGEDNGLESIRIGTSSDSLTSSKSMVIQNQFINCNGEIEVISNKSGDNIYYGNYMESSEGTLTLRHGNGCIVYKNHFDQKNKENTGGIRITGENHIVANNYIENVNGNGTTRVGISINNGVKNSELNEYFQVKNTQIKNNIFVNCSNDFAIGVQVKTECVLKPVSSEISGTISYHSDNSACFSTNSKCLGSDDMKYTNNIFYAKSLGSTPNNGGIIQKSPSELDLPSMKQKLSQLYSQENAGPNWNTNPEDSEIKSTFVEYYNNLKNKIISEISGTPPIVDDNTGGNTGGGDPTPQPETVTIEKIKYDRLLKIEQYATNIVPHLIYLQQAISDIAPSLSTLQGVLNS